MATTGVSQDLLDAEVLDADGKPSTLAELARDKVAVLVFLRHFGCIGCSQQVDALVPIVDQLATLGVKVILVGNGEPRYIAGFVERQRLDGYPMTLVTDPTLRSHRAAGFERSVWATIGPRALWADVVAMASGYLGAGRQGDAYQQGGVLVLAPSGNVLLRHATRAAPEPVAPGVIIEAILTYQSARAHAQKGLI